MNLVRYNPKRRVSVANRPSNDLFDDIFDGFFSPLSSMHNSLKLGEMNNLKVDIYEKDDKIVVEAEIAGVAKEDISVDVKGKILTLGAERKHEEDVSDENSYRRERSYGSFERKFSLPFEVEADNINANLNNGVLTLTITKPEAQVAKKITIN